MKDHEWEKTVEFDDGVTKIIVAKCYRCSHEVRTVSVNGQLVEEPDVIDDCDTMIVSKIMGK